MPDEDPTTQEFRIRQTEREAAEREYAEEAPSEEATGTHRRRSEKAAYLKQKLEERAEAERKSSG